ncbi:MAG: HAD family phosphatase [Phycisphaerales bacterium]
MGVIFDLDGVLVDTGWAHKQAWWDLAEKEDFDMSDEFFYSTFGMQNYQIIPMLIGQDVSGEKIDRLSEWKENRYREIISDKLALLPGVQKLLNDLKENGFLLAIGSSAPRVNLELVLERLSLQNQFNACITDKDVEKGKPAPDTFLKAAEKLFLSPGQCVVVEDAIQGVEAGKAAMMKVVAVTTTRKREDLGEADIVVDSLDELKAGDFIRLLNN